jgi:hypothetical protein
MASRNLYMVVARCRMGKELAAGQQLRRAILRGLDAAGGPIVPRVPVRRGGNRRLGPGLDVDRRFPHVKLENLALDFDGPQ